MELKNFKNLDTKSKVEIIMTGFLIIALVVILVTNIRIVILKKRPKALPGVSTQEITLPLTDFEEKAKRISRKQISALDEHSPWGRDPFQEVDISFSELKLQGIMWDDKTPKALINNKIVKIGDKIDVIKVVDIKRESVILNDGTGDFELKLEWKKR